MPQRNPQFIFLTIAIGFILIVFFIISVLSSLNLYLAWLAAMSIITFVFYGYDKFTALKKYGRVPEIVFHILSILGGFIGAILGMIIFRHKIRSLDFILIQLVGVVIHLIIISYLFPELLQQLF